MIFLQYTVIGTKAATSMRGAFVNCWIDRPTLIDAETIAKQMIEEGGWRIEKQLKGMLLSDGDFGMGDNAERYYKQAEIDSEVLVFNTHPIQEMP